MECEWRVVLAEHSLCMLRSCVALAPGRGRATGSTNRIGDTLRKGRGMSAKPLPEQQRAARHWIDMLLNRPMWPVKGNR